MGFLQKFGSSPHSFVVALNSKKFDHAFEVFGYMKMKKIRPDVMFVAAMLLACKNVEHMEEFLTEVKKYVNPKKFIEDVGFFNAQLKLASQHDDFPKCLALMRELRERKIQPDIYSYNSLLNTLARRGDLEACMMTVMEYMVGRDQIEPVIHTVNSLLIAALNGGKKAEVMLEICYEFSHIKPVDTTISILFQAASRFAYLGEWDSMRQLVTHAEFLMDRWKLVAGTLVQNARLNIFGSIGDIKSQDRALSALLSTHRPDVYTLGT